MGFFFNRKQSNRSSVSSDATSSEKVEAITHETHQKIQQANNAAKNLNSLLKANGITLNISIATGGHDRGK